MNKYKIIISVFLILTITSFAFLPSLKNNFVNWDDNVYVIENDAIRSLSWKKIKDIFTSFHEKNYHPLVLLSYALEYHFFKLNPLFYHLTNLILHLLNCLLVFWFLKVFSGSTLVGLISAFLFGVHPLHVESVAWISERRDVLYSFFFLSALIGYLYYIKNKSKKYYYFAILLFIFSSLSKAMAITLPILLVLIDYVFDIRISKNTLKNKIPFFIIAILFGTITFIIRYQSKDFIFKDSLNFHYNIFVANFALLFYLWKLIIPVKLSCLYPYTLGDSDLFRSVFLPSLFIWIPLIAGIIFSSKYTKKIIFGVLFFIITILPVINLVSSISGEVVADRYVYIPSIGLFYLLAEVFLWIHRWKIKYKPVINIFLTLILIEIISTLSILTWDRCNVWENSLKLWDDVISHYADDFIPIAYYNRGIAYLVRGEDKKAIFDFKKALDLDYKRFGMNRDYEEIYNKMMSEEGDTDVYNFLGLKFAQLGGMQESILLFKKAIEIDPTNIEAYINLSAAYGNSGRYKEAIAIAKRAVELNPNSAQTHYNLSVAYYFDKQYDLSLKHIEIAIKLGFKPDTDFLEKLKSIKKIDKEFVR
jgi:tetratricopeptide (TPR) repeat protein